MLNFFESYFFYKQIFRHKGNGILTSKLKTGLQWETNQTVVSFLSDATELDQAPRSNLVLPAALQRG